MIFNLRKPSDLNNSEIKQIIGYREDLELDFKDVIDNKQAIEC